MTTPEPIEATRILRSQKISPGSIYLRGEEPPTPQQVSAVLHALADHTLLMYLVSEEVAALGNDRADLGENWRQATGIGRYLQRLGNQLDGYEGGDGHDDA